MTECMTQEDAMNMNNEQAIRILKPLRDMMRDQHGCPISDAFFALNKAIEALSAQPELHGYDIDHLSDAVKTVLHFVESCDGTTAYLITPDGESLSSDWGYVEEGLRCLVSYCDKTPSAQPKQGEWIDRSEGGRILHPWWESHECNQCGCYGSKAWNFCPNCGSYNGGRDTE